MIIHLLATPSHNTLRVLRQIPEVDFGGIWIEKVGILNYNSGFLLYFYSVLSCELNQ